MNIIGIHAALIIIFIDLKVHKKMHYLTNYIYTTENNIYIYIYIYTYI